MDNIFPPLTPEILVPRIGEYLVEKGLITSDDLLSALEFQQILKQSQTYPPLLGQILIMLGKVSRPQLDLAITEQIILLRQALQNANQALEQRVRDRTVQLEYALKRLADASQVKSNFIANISHELRTPLTHIRGYLELISGKDLGSLTTEQEEAVHIMQRSTTRLEQLIEDLILFSDSQREKFVLNLTLFSLQDLCLTLVERVQTRAQQKEIHLDFNADAGIPPVTGDEEKIGWVVSQLLDNALKFTPARGNVSLQLSQDKNLILVTITDDGIGIPGERIEEIFEPFHQLDGSSTRQYGGTGLGLSLAKQIIEAHGSVLNVSSHTGKGSRFEFHIDTNRSTSTLPNWLASNEEG